jgi:hypothetical protein
MVFMALRRASRDWFDQCGGVAQSEPVKRKLDSRGLLKSYLLCVEYKFND